MITFTTPQIKPKVPMVPKAPPAPKGDWCAAYNCLMVAVTHSGASAYVLDNIERQAAAFPGDALYAWLLDRMYDERKDIAIGGGFVRTRPAPPRDLVEAAQKAVYLLRESYPNGTPTLTELEAAIDRATCNTCTNEIQRGERVCQECESDAR